MLQITIPSVELWDEVKGEFINLKERTIQLEHSLVSISKWESKWCKAFLSKAEKTHEEVLDYVRCMTVTQNVEPDVYKYLTKDNINQIHDYINAPMTATVFSKDESGKRNKEVITSELIYYWMITANIPFECQRWHLNRLLTLIRIWNLKNSKPKKQSRRELLSRNAELNAARRKLMNSKG